MLQPCGRSPSATDGGWPKRPNTPPTGLLPLKLPLSACLPVCLLLPATAFLPGVVAGYVVTVRLGGPADVARVFACLCLLLPAAAACQAWWW